MKSEIWMETICPNCQAINTGEQNLCLLCSATLRAAAPGPEKSPAAPVPPPQEKAVAQPEEQQARVAKPALCTNCGQRLYPGKAFCTYCGERVRI